MRTAQAEPAPSDPGRSALLSDLYQLAMMEVYYQHEMQQTAVFEFFVRRLPPARSYLIAAGLEQALDFLQDLRFTDAELAWMSASGHFKPEFVEQLRDFRFSGDVHAMPEGSVFFADEPILRVTAPLPQAQLVETRLVNLLQFQTMIASKAARCVLNAPDRILVDFGLRRSHGAEAGLLAARASYLAGFAGTATVLASQRFGMPCYGTMAHSFIQAHEDEYAAFARFSRERQHNVVLLIDTYDTLQGARRVVELSRELAHEGIAIASVRLDSGDLAVLSREVRSILDQGGCRDIRIFASGSLDEYALAALVEAGAPIDGFGIGTSLDVSADAPYLDCVYKLEEYAGIARRKRSSAKSTWPGRKQVYRRFDRHGKMLGDMLTLDDDSASGQPLLEPVMRNGERLAESPSLDNVRDRARASLDALPQTLLGLDRQVEYPVEVSAALLRLTEQVDARFD